MFASCGFTPSQASKHSDREQTDGDYYYPQRIPRIFRRQVALGTDDHAHRSSFNQKNCDGHPTMAVALNLSLPSHSAFTASCWFTPSEQRQKSDREKTDGNDNSPSGKPGPVGQTPTFSACDARHSFISLQFV